ncbi:MAG: tetratricopeptide repeat protein [Nitrospirae bacterium]|nr:tetratricopeptide repeat protein [Nitrospirota bacterium]
MPANRFGERILILLFLLSVFFLAIVKIEDPDSLIHLSCGRIIWELKGFPATEPFVYTMHGEPFRYTSRFFGLTYYLSYLAFGYYGVILLKAATVTSAFYILLRDSLRPYRNLVVAVIVMTAIVMLVRHRFVERPDLFLMVFLSFSIFSLNAYVYDNKKYIYALPFIHMLWANSHSSIPLMFIPFLSFLGGGVLQQFMEKRGIQFSCMPSKSQLKTILWIFLFSFAASLISDFTTQYGFGAQSLTSDWIKQEILEVRPLTWKAWKSPYILTAVVLLSFILNRRRLSLIHLFMVIPFIFLSFSGVRFVFLLGIVAGPILARNISAYFDKSSIGNRFIGKKPAMVVLALWIVCYTALTLADINPLGRSPGSFGFGINYTNFHEDALNYMDRRNIYGRVFNKIEWGQYIIWRDFPKRTPFADGRFYLPDGLLEKQIEARGNPAVLDELYSKYGFESILINYTKWDPSVKSMLETSPDIDMALLHQGWALVYWDDLCLIYLKKGGRYDSVIKEDEYRYIRPANGIYSINAKLHNDYYRPLIISEIKRNISETGSFRGYTFLGAAYNELGLYREAIDAFAHVKNTVFLPGAYAGMGHAYFRLGYPDESLMYYKKLIPLVKDANTYFNVGKIYFTKGDGKTAVEYFNKALDIDSNLLFVYPLLIGSYEGLGMRAEVVKTRKMYEDAKLRYAGRMYFQEGNKAYFEKRLEDAVKEFKKSIAVDPLNIDSYKMLGDIYSSMDNIPPAYEYYKKAIDINAEYAPAHYGLALAYEKAGDTKMAERHMKEYLRIKPSGYFSRRAKEKIEILKSSK